jgi:RNA binding exosome subunit
VRRLAKALPVSEVDISCFAHATEDEGKVLDAVRRILPPALVESVLFAKTKAQGHYGNPITVFETKIMDKEIVKAIVGNLAANLTPLDKETLSNEVERHVEKGNFYVRLDKQAAFQGEFKLAVVDPIRIRLRLKKSRSEDVVNICREIGMLPR